MKNLITGLALCIGILGYSQSASIEHNDEEVKFKNVSITVSVDSAEEINSTFTTKGIKKLLDNTDEGEAVSFEIICNSKDSKDGVKSNVSYKLEGNTDDKKSFLKMIKKIKKAAIKYYNN
jgi:hypothetical protein